MTYLIVIDLGFQPNSIAEQRQQKLQDQGP